MLDTSKYASLDRLRDKLSNKQELESWLLNNKHPNEREQQVLTHIEATLSGLVSYPGYVTSASNLLQARTWDEYQEHWWTLTVAFSLALKGLLREMEATLPNGRIPDIMGEVLIKGQPSQFYVECKSWRFHPASEAIIPSEGLTQNKRVNRMKEKMLKQLPEDRLGVWAWDKMRDGISSSHTLGATSPELGVGENQVIREVCEAVPQIAAVMVKMLDDDFSTIIWTVPNLNSKWPQSHVSQLVTRLNPTTA